MRVIRLGRRTAALAGVLVFLAMSMVLGGGQATAAKPAATLRPADATSGSVTKTHVATDPATKKTYNLSVTVSQTQNLQPRQNISVSWSGFQPTSNYDVTDTSGAQNQDEYPTVLLQCWGTDTSTAPLDPTHCFAGSPGYGIPPNIANRVYTDTLPNPPITNAGLILGSFLGFTDVTGKHWEMNNFNATPTDLQSSSLSPPNSQIAYTTADGTRNNLQFEVRSKDQYPSLGCSAVQACSIVVLPILHPGCVATAVPNCTGPALNQPGRGNGTASANPYLRGATWWLSSEWQNRISFPISLAPQPTDCPVSDTRPQVPVTGSEIAYTAMYSWVPFYCSDPTRFNLEYVRTAEPQARNALTQYPQPGYANAVLTSLPVTGSSRPLVHAPIAISGFAVTFQIDDANSQQVTKLNLTPLLLAKLLTNSYTGNTSTEPALAGNPSSLFADPEFAAVNPGFTIFRTSFPSDVNMIMLGAGDQSDTIWALTSYINADPEARTWLDGAPDAYSGMTVNPAYRSYSLPKLATDILDQFTESADNPGFGPCEKVNPTPNQLLFSQPENNLQDAAFALLNGRSPASSVCNVSGVGTGTIATWGKAAPQAVGSRDLIALTSVAFADQYGLPVASLQVHKLATGRLFAGPSPTSMAAAMAFASQDKATGVVSLDYPHLSPNAYPGTVPIYAAVPTSGLDHTTATDYANFLNYAVTAGQIPGTAMGQLPAGYAPLTGALDPLAQFTLQAAKDVAAQNGQVPVPPPNLGGQIASALGLPGAGGVGTSGGGGNTANPSGPGAGPTSAGGGSSSSATTPPRPQTVALTRGGGSWLADWGLPALLIIGMLAGLLVPVVRIAGQPGHPIRVLTGRSLAKLRRRRD
jgi:hypothetical protein